MTQQYVGGLPEKRVKKVFDAIYSGRNDSALKECDALATKYSKCSFPLVLKAIALLNHGVRDESLDLCLKAIKMLFLDFDKNVEAGIVVLANLRNAFCRLGQSEMGMQCYETAVRLVPDNLELMTGLFECYVAESLYLKQQQIARKMYKLSLGETFLIWMVCSIYFQVFYGNGGDNLLHLAERFIKDHVSSTALVETEALKVYLLLLEKQQKYGDALEIMEGNLGYSLIKSEHSRLLIQGRLLLKLGRYAAAADAFHKAIEQSHDTLDCFLPYLAALLEDENFYTESICAKPPQDSTKKHNLHLSDEVFDSRMSSAANLIETLKPQMLLSRYYFAQLEIEKCKVLFGKGDADEFVEELVKHFIRFGHWTWFIPDFKMFVEVLDNDRKTMFVEKLFLCPEVDKTVIAFGKSITRLKLQYMIGNMDHLPVKDLEEQVLQMVHAFFKGLPLSKDLHPTVQKSHEEILSLAFNILVMIFRRTGDFGYMMEATLLMEYGIIIRRDLIQYRCSLVSLYLFWNSHSIANRWSKSLDLEKFLLEPISEKIISQMFTSLTWQDLEPSISNWMKFLDDQLVTCGDAAYRAFHNRSYLKAMSHIHFKDGLQRSLMYAMLRIEMPLSKLKQDSYDIDEFEVTLDAEGCGNPCLKLANEMEEKTPVFNEDLKKPQPSKAPTIDDTYFLGGFQGASLWQRQNMDKPPESFKENILKSLKQRSLVPRLLYLSTCSASASVEEMIGANETAADVEEDMGTNETTAASVEEDEILDVRRNLKELKTLLDRYAETLGFPFNDAVELVLKVACGKKHLEELGPNLSQWLTFAVFLNAWNLSSRKIRLSKRHPSVFCLLHLVDILLHKSVQQLISSANNAPTCCPGRFFFSMIQVACEPLSWHGLILQSCMKTLIVEKKHSTLASEDDPFSYLLLLHELKSSSELLAHALSELETWASEQLLHQDDDDEFIGKVYKKELKEGEAGPGKVSTILESYILGMKEGQDIGFELDDDTVELFKSWSIINILKQIRVGQYASFTNFAGTCELKSQRLKEISAGLLELE